MGLKDTLIKKVNLLRDKYVNRERLPDCVENISERENAVMKSMERWHKNLHLSDTDLKSLLEEVNQENLLDVKEHMTPIPETLRTFLTKKLDERSPRRQFAINEILEPLVQSIKDLYNEKLDNRNTEDEFGEDNVFMGMNSHDMIFYRKTFLPAALYFVYKKIHHLNYETEEHLLNELFSIGAGAKTVNLIPEIVPFCEKCKHEISKVNTCYKDIQHLNMHVFKQQLRDNFFLEGLLGSSSDSSKSSDLPKEDKSSEDISDFNPFDQDCEGSLPKYPSSKKPLIIINDEADEETDLFQCSLCSKHFTRLDFLDYHKKLFHKEIVVIPKFVEDTTIDMMKTFDAGTSSSHRDCVSSSSEEVNTEQAEVVIPKFVEDTTVDMMKTLDAGTSSSHRAGVNSSPEEVKPDQSEVTVFRKRAVRKVLKYPK